MTSVLLVDDHELIRRGLRDALRDEGVTCAGEAGSWDELRHLLDRVRFDVMLLDINLPGRSGFDILELLAARVAPPRTLVVSMYPEDTYAVQALRAGAWGYVAKSQAAQVLAQAVRTVAAGERFVTPQAAQELARVRVSCDALLPHQRLSAREQVLLARLAAGVRIADIAAEWNVPPRTVSVYRARLLEKMKLSSNAELAHYARRHQLLPGAKPDQG